MLNRTLTRGDIAREIGCTPWQASNILVNCGHCRQGEKNKSWWMYESELEELCMDREKLMRAMVREARERGEKNRERAIAEYRKRVEEHVCSRCKKPLAEDYYYTICEECRKYESNSRKANYDKAEARRQYHKRKKDGVCIHCLKPLPEGWKIFTCPECQKKEKVRHNARYREKVIKAIEKGVCVTCGRVNEDKRYISCCICREKKNKRTREWREREQKMV